MSSVDVTVFESMPEGIEKPAGNEVRVMPLIIGELCPDFARPCAAAAPQAILCAKIA